MDREPRPEQRPAAFRQAVMLTSTGAVVNVLFLFLETTLAARLISTDSYGIFVLVVAVVNFLVMAVDFGSKTAVAQLIARSEADRQAALVSSALLFRLVVIAAASALIWLPSSLFSLFEPTRALQPYVGQVPLMLLVASLDQLLFGMLQGFQAYRPLATAQIVRSVLRLGLTLLLLGPLRLGVAGLVASWIVSFGVSVAYQLRALPVEKRWTLQRPLLRELLRFGVPLQFGGFLWFMFGQVQVFMLGAFSGPASVAHYAVAAKIPQALQQVSESYMAVYFPKMTSLLARGMRGKATQMLDTSLRLVSFAAAFLALVGVVFSQQIVVILFSPKYAASSPAFALLMIALHMVLIVNLMGYTLTSAGYPGRSLVVDVARTGTVVLGSLALIPFLGFMGAACAYLVSSYVGSPVVVRLLRRDGTAVRVAPFLKQTGVLLLCAALSWWLRPAGLAGQLAMIPLFFVLSAGFGTVTGTDLSLLLAVNLPIGRHLPGPRARRGGQLLPRPVFPHSSPEGQSSERQPVV